MFHANPISKSFTGKKLYFEVIRVVAILLVIFNHTEAFNIPLMSNPMIPQIAIKLFLSICDKTAVPLFFMISGALLLHKEESFKTLICKRILRFCIIILFIQFIQHAYAHYVLGANFGIRMFFMALVRGYCIPVPAQSMNLTIWFLYAYLAFLALLPFLRLLAKHMTNEHFVFLFVLQLTTWAFLPYADTFYTKYLFLCNNAYLFTLAGYYAEHRIRIESFNKKWIIISCATSLLCILVSIIMYRVAQLVSVGKFANQYTLCFTGGLLIPCITLFLLSKKILSGNIKPAISKVICLLGSSVFFIMLFENILREFSRFVITSYTHFSSIYMRDLSITLFAACLGFALGIVFKRIPIIRKFI